MENRFEFEQFSEWFVDEQVIYMSVEPEHNGLLMNK